MFNYSFCTSFFEYLSHNLPYSKILEDLAHVLRKLRKLSECDPGTLLIKWLRPVKPENILRKLHKLLEGDSETWLIK